MGQQIRKQSSCPQLEWLFRQHRSIRMCIYRCFVVEFLYYLSQLELPHLRGDYWWYFYDMKWMKTIIYLLIIINARRLKRTPQNYDNSQAPDLPCAVFWHDFRLSRLCFKFYPTTVKNTPLEILVRESHELFSNDC